MGTGIKTQVEKTFLSLPREERETIISHGTALRLSDLRKRLFLAESKMRHFEEKYQVTLDQLDADGLPDDADYEMHEDYIMWHHWAEVADRVKSDADKHGWTRIIRKNGQASRSNRRNCSIKALNWPKTS